MQLIHLCCLALLVCAVVADDKHPVYTIVSSGEQFCMQNDLPEDTEIEAIFNMTSITGGSLPSDMFIDVFVRNPDQSIYAQKKFKPAGDSIRVTGKESGVYEACATIPKTSMWSKEQYVCPSVAPRHFSLCSLPSILPSSLSSSLSSSFIHSFVHSFSHSVCTSTSTSGARSARTR